MDLVYVLAETSVTFVTNEMIETLIHFCLSGDQILLVCMEGQRRQEGAGRQRMTPTPNTNSNPSIDVGSVGRPGRRLAKE